MTSKKTLSEKKNFAKKSLGQNFLTDYNYVEKIISALNPKNGETVIEIGPGRGALTKKLIESSANIVAIEIDRDLIPILSSEFREHENFHLIEQDALTVDFRLLLGEFLLRDKDQKCKLVANLPYYISTAILRRLIEQRECFSELVLMLQREVVERIMAEPGNSERGYLSVLVEAYCESKKLFDVPPNAFRPIPKIWSSIIKLKFRDLRPIMSDVGSEKVFLRLIEAGFAQKRKTILNNLKNAQGILSEFIEKKSGASRVLESAQIEPNLRAEDLTMDDWTRLTEVITH